ncbi:hypothetical protein BDY21DRAFT_389917 [Lineolata rhizophorae]|uniref:UBA/TS-N domain-containing protein n=1 Tax=Lineolata rhizophorae TaxID=578093 RepID=A0A6A6PEQ4_9PEZI|nr:hypothetical protein BDY21DRAFT_389917 [Lineolata rhizophorae]
MADKAGGVDMNHPILNLAPEEKRVFTQLFQQADPDKLNVVTGENAVKFFEPTGIAPQILGEIWQIADTENRGLLTFAGFCQVLRLIAHYQSGRGVSAELAFRPGPLPKFDGFNPSTAAPPPAAANLRPQSSGPIRVPPLTPDKSTEYAGLFEKSGAENGLLGGETAKTIFEKAGLPNDVLGKIWSLADTETRGALGVTEFIIAMHLIASYRNGSLKGLPSTLPVGLYEAAARRVPPPGRGPGGSRPIEPPGAIPRQLSGSGMQRNQSPMTRPPYGTPPQSAQPTGSDWLISPSEKSNYDALFKKVDTQSRGHITGEQAVGFFSDSGLPEAILAHIWDLADINSDGQLNRDEFAVAMHLIRQQRPNPGLEKLPATLPSNLVPPSMQGQVRPPQQFTAPTFDNAAYSSNMSKSAADDLFDAFSSPPPAPVQTHQSTGGSGQNFSRPFDNDPFGAPQGSPKSPTGGYQPSPRNAPSGFKPFVPTSSFGQGLTSQGTGASGSSHSKQPAMEDLLGDNDAEANKKITQDTIDLGNMSNQIGTLRTQMQEVQSKKQSTEGDISGVSTQKRDLELRLAQFRTQYEQEVKHVKTLEDRLTASRNETRKLQQDLAMIEGSYQDLQSQHRQISTALEADQRENASLKERIRQLNGEIGQLRPQLEKMRADARQQKGMVSINKKQLQTNEGERDKIKSEMSDLSRSMQEEQRSTQSSVTETGGPSVSSPAPSNASHGSMNPFFRKSPQQSVDNARSPSAFSPTSATQNQRDFDNFFGASAFTSPQTAAPPPTSFKSESHHGQGQSVQSGPSLSDTEVPTPSTSPPLSYRDSPHTAEAQAPPSSGQFAANFLPLREGRNESFTSSTKASASGSRLGGAETPTNAATSSPFSATHDKEPRPSEPTRADTGHFPNLFDRNMTSSPAASATSDPTHARAGSKGDERKDAFQPFSIPAGKEQVPGAFPADDMIRPNQTGESTMSNQSRGSGRPNDPFGMASTSSRDNQTQQSRWQPGASHKVDFDAAFAGSSSGPGRGFQEKQHTGSSVNGSVDSATAVKFNQEFPPIKDLGDDDDSDSNSEQGFADNFTSPSPQHKRDAARGQGQQKPTDHGADVMGARPQLGQMDSSTSGLPTPNAQKSPPTYNQSQTASGIQQPSNNNNKFPAEFGGLLPSRNDPTSPPQADDKPFGGSSTQGQSLFGVPTSQQSKGSSPSMAAAFSAGSPPSAADTPTSTAPSDAYHSAVSFPSGAGEKSQSPDSSSAAGTQHMAAQQQSQQPQASKPSASAFDFDTGFDDLTDARDAADDRAGDDEDFILAVSHRRAADFDSDFNPVFDSPAASKSNTIASQHTPTGKHDHDAFGDFEHSISHAFGKQPVPSQQATAHDWDDIWSKLGQPDPSSGAGAGATANNAAAPGESGSAMGSNMAGPSGSAPGGESSSGVAVNKATTSGSPTTDEAASAAAAGKEQMPQLGRALTTGTEHDDPILKKLTGMGYPRDKALAALEKYDYDITKVGGPADPLNAMWF